MKAKDVHVYYTDNSDPGTLHKAYPCPRKLKASTVFPCVKSVKVLWSSNPALRRDLRVLLLGTFDDPKAGTFKPSHGRQFVREHREFDDAEPGTRGSRLPAADSQSADRPSR